MEAAMDAAPDTKVNESNDAVETLCVLFRLFRSFFVFVRRSCFFVCVALLFCAGLFLVCVAFCSLFRLCFLFLSPFLCSAWNVMAHANTTTLANTEMRIKTEIDTTVGLFV